MSRKNKTILIILGCLFIIGIILLTVYLINVHNYKEKVAKMTVSDINLKEIPDGTYIGECDVDFIDVKLSVTVKNGCITDIKLLKHKNGKGTPAEAIIPEIIDQQTLNVDAVSGATNSSKAIKKAIENALTVH